MRTVLYGAGCSLDGYIAGESDEVDWLAWSRDVERISREVWDATDDVIGLNLHPILPGRGIEMFPPPGRHSTWQLSEARPLQGDCFYLRYRAAK